jgi:hypothetical protein
MVESSPQTRYTSFEERSEGPLHPMRGDMKTRTLLGAVVLMLALPAVAGADSGGISNVHAVVGGQVEATYTATSTYCTQYGYCGFFPYATQVGLSEPCDAYNTTGRLTYVGELQDASGTQAGTATFYPATTGSFKLCLHVSQGDDRKVTVAESIYTPPATAPSTPPVSTAPVSTAPSGAVAPLTIADARANLPSILRTKFAGRFTSRRNFKRDCYRLMTSTVRCRVRWDHGQWRYSGAVDMKNDPEDPEDSLVYRTTVRRKRLHTPSKTTPPSPAPSRPAPSPSSCDASYKGACLKPNVSDYDCAGGSGDGPYYVQGPVTVVGDDHYDLDRDGDGIACES